MWTPEITERFFPELAEFAEGEERQAALLQAWRSAPMGRGIAGLFVAVVLAIIAEDLLSGSIGPGDGIWQTLAGILNGLIAVVAAPTVLTLFVRRHIRRNLRIQLNDLGRPTCVNCGYNLTGNTSGVCPECGSNT